MSPKTRTHTLCEPAQSKYTSTFHKNHLIKQKFTGKMPRPKLGQQHRQTLCASLRNRKRMSRIHKSHYINKFAGKMPRPKTPPQTLREPARSKRVSKLHKSHFIRKFTSKMPQTKTAPQILREPAQSKRMSKFQGNFIRKFADKMPKTKTAPQTLRMPAAKMSRETLYQRKLGSNTSKLRMTFTWWNWLWWRVVRDLAIHAITIHNKRIRSGGIDLDEGWYITSQYKTQQDITKE